MSKKFSIIIPCYNVEKYIVKTIESVLNQTYGNFEVIIINDGSTDNTFQIVYDFAKKDKRIKVYTKENGGVSSARNYGIRKAQGDYIYFLDGDDLIKPELLEVANHIFNKINPDMIAFGYQRVDMDFNNLKTYTTIKYDKKVLTGYEFQKLFFLKKINQCMCSFIIKSKIIKENSIYFDENTIYGEDHEFQLKCNIKCSSIYFDAKVYFMYLNREGSAVNKPVILNNFDVYFRMKRYINTFLEESYYKYLCYMFIYYIKQILEKGTDKKTVQMILDNDVILKKFKFSFNKYDIITSFFIIAYKIFLKNFIKNKHNLKS